jgi:hypothetical protein
MQEIKEIDELKSPEYYKHIYDEKIKQQQQMDLILKRQHPSGPKLHTQYKFEEHSEQILTDKKKDSEIKIYPSIKIDFISREISGPITEVVLNRKDVNIKEFILNNFSSICCLNKDKDIIFNYDILHKKELRRERFKYNYTINVIRDSTNNTNIILKIPNTFFVIDIVEFIIERNINEQINNIINQNICPNFIKYYYATKNNILINKLENKSNDEYENLPIFSAVEFYDGDLSQLFYKLKKIYFINQQYFKFESILNKKLNEISDLSKDKLIEIGINLDIVDYSKIKNYSIMEIIHYDLCSNLFEKCKIIDILNKKTIEEFKSSIHYALTKEEFKFTIHLLKECSLKEIITYTKEPRLANANTEIYELINSVLFQIVVGIYFLNSKMNTMYNNLTIQDIVYKEIDRDTIFKYVINGKEYYVRTFGFLIAYSNLSKCLNANILCSEYINTSPNLEQLKDVYIKYMNGNYKQFQNLNEIMTEFKYRFVEPFELIEHMFERTFGAYKHYIRKLYYLKFKKDIQKMEHLKVIEEIQKEEDLKVKKDIKKIEFLKKNEERPKLISSLKKKTHWSDETTPEDLKRKKIIDKTDDIKNNALYEISKCNLDAFINIAKYLKNNTFDIVTVNNLYRETFRNKYYTDEKFKELYPSFNDEFSSLNYLVSEIVNIKKYDDMVFENYFSFFQTPMNGKICTFDLDKHDIPEFKYDESVSINMDTPEICEVNLLFNYELSIPQYANNVIPDNIRITKNINKIYAFSDIHADIMPLIINLRDCSSVIRKKGEYTFDKLSIPDYDAICELNKTHEKIYSNVEENIRYNGEDKYLDDLNYEWCGDNSIVVICGDFLDNGRHNKMNLQKKVNEFPMEEAKILMFINAINKQAIRHGGRIFKLLGNHEEKNISIMWKETKQIYDLYNYQSNFSNASGEQEIENYPRINNIPYELDFLSNRQRFFLPSKPGALLLAEDSIFILLAIKNFIFVHGGISNEHITIENINFINNFINYYLVKGDIYKDMLFDINLSKINASIIYEFFINKISSILRDSSFGYLNSNKKAVKDSSTQEQCDHLQERLNAIYNNLNKYISESHEKVKIKPNKNIFLEENYNGNDIYSNCIGNFWFGIDDINKLNNNLNFVMGHIFQYNGFRFSADGKIIEKKNISINDFNLTKIHKTTHTFIEYGIRKDKQYISEKNDPPIGMTSSCLFKKRNFPSLYRLDVSTSRSFNDLILNEEKLNGRSTELSGQHFRFPQALYIEYENNEYTVFLRKTQFDIIKIHLPTLNLPIEKMSTTEFYYYIVKYVNYKEKKYREKYDIKKTSVYT